MSMAALAAMNGDASLAHKQLKGALDSLHEDILIPLKSSTFQHNTRIWIGFLPCLLLLLAFGGHLTFGLLVGGMLVSYVFDLMGSLEGTFASFWMTVILMELLLVVNSFHLLWISAWNMVLIYIFASFTLFSGFWGTMQFSSMIHRFPVVLLNTERLTMALFPIIFYMILTWGLLGLAGPEGTPFFLIGVSVVFYRLYATPIASSFRFPIKNLGAKQFSFENGYLLDSPELCLQFLVYTLTPGIVFAALNRGILFDPRVFSVFLLVKALPLFLITVHSPSSFLWWTGLSEESLTRLKTLLTSFSLVLAVGVFEYRVVFRSYGSYIFFPWPLNVILVTLSLYSFAFLGLNLYTGNFKMIDYRLALPVAMVGSATASLVLGLPILVALTFLAGSLTFVQYYYHRRPEAYIIFLCCTSLIVLHFLYQHFFFLDFTFDQFDLPLKIAAMMALVLLITCLAVIPVAFQPVPRLLLTAVIQPILILQAVLLASLEQILYEQREDMYPGYLIIITSYIGVMVAWEFHKTKKISKTVAWILTSIYCSKLSLFLTPLHMAVPSTLLLLLPILKINLFTENPKMPLREGASYVVAIGLVSFLTRQWVPQRVLALFLRREPSESLVFASFLIIWGLGCLSLSYKFFGHLITAKKANLLLLVFGVLIAFLQPDVSFSEANSSFSKTFGGSALGNTRLAYLDQADSRWTSWPLIIGVIFNAVIFLASKPALSRSYLWRLGYSVISGLCAALFVGGSFIPFSAVDPLLYVCYTLSGTLFFLNLSHAVSPISSSGRHLVFGTSTFAALQLLTSWLLTGVFQRIPGGRGKALEEEAQMVLLNVHLICHVLVALMVNQLITGTAGPQPSPGARPAPSSMKGKRILSAINTPARNPTDLLLGTAGNISTICGALAIRSVYESVATRGYFLPFAVAPVFLLLNPGTFLQFRLTSKTRYFPMITVLFVLAIFLSLSDFLTLWRSPDSYHFTVWKNLLFLVIPLPSLYYFWKYMGDFVFQGGYLWYNLTPMNLAPLTMANLPSVQITAALALTGAVVRYIVSERLRKESMQHL